MRVQRYGVRARCWRSASSCGGAGRWNRSRIPAASTHAAVAAARSPVKNATRAIPSRAEAVTLGSPSRRPKTNAPCTGSGLLRCRPRPRGNAPRRRVEVVLDGDDRRRLDAGVGLALWLVHTPSEPASGRSSSRRSRCSRSSSSGRALPASSARVPCGAPASPGAVVRSPAPHGSPGSWVRSSRGSTSCSRSVGCCSIRSSPSRVSHSSVARPTGVRVSHSPRRRGPRSTSASVRSCATPPAQKCEQSARRSKRAEPRLTCFPLGQARLVGSPGWTRTSNPSVNSRMLCQLSYRGSSGWDSLRPG
jgi:hypothetical protein